MTSKTNDLLQLRYWLLAAGVVGGLVGCDAGSGLRAGGTVRYENKPIEDGVIKFQSDAGQYAAARIKNGRYEVEKTSSLTPGIYTVKITAQRQAGTATVQETTLAHDAGDVVPVIEQYIPSQYNEESTLTVNLNVSKSQYDFDLPPQGQE